MSRLRARGAAKVAPFVAGQAGVARQRPRRRAGAQKHWAAPFVLALLCLRAFIPAGFMLSSIDGQLGIVLCDTDAKIVSHHHAGDHNDYNVGHHHTQTDSTCPYAQSSGPAPLPVLPAPSVALITTLTSAPIPTAQIHCQFGPTRQQSPRGPPSLA